MADEDESFVSRWSRLKRSGGAAEPEKPSAETPPDDAEATSVADPAAAEPEGEAEEPTDLPAIEDLTKESDFTVFMRKGVPDEVRNQALRKLWTSDPVLANLDGLLEYGEDFSLPFKQHAGKAVATLWRVGQGMPDPVKEAILDAVEGEPAEPTGAPAAKAVAQSRPEDAEGGEGEAPSPAAEPPDETA